MDSQYSQVPIITLIIGGAVEDGDCDISWLSRKDSEHTRSYEVAALRETFEETGLFLFDSPSATISTPSESTIQDWRQSILNGDKSFLEMHKKFNVLPYTNFKRWARWLPPLKSIRPEELTSGQNRIKHSGLLTNLIVKSSFFDTHFYLTCLSKDRYFSQFELSQDGTETVELFWKTPKDALDLFENGEINLLPPQYCMLTELSMMTFDRLMDENINAELVQPELIGINKDGNCTTSLMCLPGDYFHSTANQYEKKHLIQRRFSLGRQNGRANNVIKMHQNNWRRPVPASKM